MPGPMRLSDYFDEMYRTHDRYWWREPDRHSLKPEDYPSSLLAQQTLRLLAPHPQGRALDIGAGEGSDAIRLALMGYEVDAVELSTVAAAKIKYFANQTGVKVRVTVADAQNYTPDGLYDVIICNGVLHYVEDKDSVISRMQQATCDGGFNVVSLWSNYTPVPECHEFVPVYGDAEDGVVTSRYKAWPKEFIYFERDKPEAAHSDLPPHRHSHIKFIARKPAPARGTPDRESAHAPARFLSLFRAPSAGFFRFSDRW
jgi:SAM-dependent methyltransferase